MGCYAPYRAAQNIFYPRNLEFWVNYGKIQETVRCVLFLVAHLVRKVDSEPNVMPQKILHAGFSQIFVGGDHFRSSTLKKGQDLLAAQHVGNVQEIQEPHHVTVTGECLPETSINNRPYALHLEMAWIVTPFPGYKMLRANHVVLAGFPMFSRVPR